VSPELSWGKILFPAARRVAERTLARTGEAAFVRDRELCAASRARKSDSHRCRSGSGRPLRRPRRAFEARSVSISSNICAHVRAPGLIGKFGRRRPGGKSVSYLRAPTARCERAGQGRRDRGAWRTRRAGLGHGGRGGEDIQSQRVGVQAAAPTLDRGPLHVSQ